MSSFLQTRSRDWTFTLHNYDEDHFTELAALDCKYLIYGKETVPGLWEGFLENIDLGFLDQPEFLP